jgi:hypothetical protein
VLSEDWDPGEDPRVRELEEARARLIERLVTAGSAAALRTLESMDELRLLASFLWLPRDSAPLRRLGLRIQPPGAGMAQRALLYGPGFEVELDNYRFTATTASRQAEADAVRAAHAARQTPPKLIPIGPGEPEDPRRRPVMPIPASAPIPIAARAQPAAASASTSAPGLGTSVRTPPTPFEDPDDSFVTRPLPAVVPGGAGGPAPHPTRPVSSPPAPPSAPAAPQRAPTSGRRLWPFGRANRGSVGATRDSE